jgi:WD40 repeat protein
MRILRVSRMAFLVLGCVAGSARAQQTASYAKDVRPFLVKYCLECHNAKNHKAGLDLETYKTLRAGSEGGEVVVPGKPDESPLVFLVEKKDKPHMPPKEAKRHPAPKETAILRAWVAAGAKDDSATVAVTLPDIKPRAPRTAAVAALAYRPDGKLLVAGGYGEALLIDVASGNVIGKLPAQSAAVTALAFAPEGRCLAVAGGTSGAAGQVRLYTIAPGGQPKPKPCHVLLGHADIVQDLAFSPDGTLLATCGYDRLVKLWEVSSGKEVHTFKEHSDSVYGVAFSPNGRHLASVSADRAVKIWDVAKRKLAHTLGESTDWLYAVAWSPDGKHLAAAGVDKSIRVWEISANGGTIRHAVFAHEAPVSRLVYSQDGKTLYSLGEDNIVKAWEARRMTETRVYAKQPEATLALAVRPDHKQFALGRYDGVALLIDEASGKVQSQPLPHKPMPLAPSKLTPASGQRGQTIRVRIDGKNLDEVTDIIANHPGATAKLVADTVSATSLQAEITFPATTPAGVYQVQLKSAAGQSAPLSFTVDLFGQVMEREPDNSPGTGHQTTLPATLVGAIAQTGDVDFYRFDAKAGDQIGVHILTKEVGSKLDPHLTLTDLTGRVLTESGEGFLGHAFDRAGTYAIGVRDREYRGDKTMLYRLHVGDIPVVTAIFPLGLQRGSKRLVQLEGVHLGDKDRVVVEAAADAALGSNLTLPFATPLGKPLGLRPIVVGEFPETITPSNKAPWLATPGTANGRILTAGMTETWKFHAKKGQRLIVEVQARRLGSALDSYIEVLDDKGQTIPRATLRSQAKTYVTFRDHDSAVANIRIEAWNDLAVNDHIYVGGELLRIRSLPTHPDADCFFFSAGGQRTGFLDTTPTHHAQGAPMYKVAIHPPGATFSPNGFPVVTLYHRNDDGGPGYGRDSRLFFDPPADGTYQVRIGDTRGQSGKSYAYRLTVRPPRPSFDVKFTPTSPAVWKGGALPITVNLDRLDGFDGEVKLKLLNLPPGFSAPATSIGPDENSTAFSLFADKSAANPAKTPPLKLVAEAIINGQNVVKEVTGGPAKVVEAGDILATTEQSEVTLTPGGRTKLTVRIERKNGFAGRIPIDVRGLPHGVRVLDIGLNGILITERETVRTFVLYAEAWVQPQDHPIVVLARREGKNTQHAAKSVLLKVR